MENFIKFKGDLMKHHLKWIAAVLALGLSLVIIQNEKQLPPELQNSKS